MHGYSSGSTVVVNAEVDSMGGVIESGVGIGLKTSPRQAAIEKAQAELRQEYDIRQERRRELDFLENGGNPLDFRIGNATSVSVQSTSVTDQHLDQFVTSEAKVSFAFTASPHGDSVESSGRLRAPSVCEPNSADNLLLFDADNELPEGERNSRRPTSKNNITQSEQSSQLEGSQNAKETEDSAIFRPYARRNRSKTNRDGARSSSTDVVHGRGGSKDSTALILKINNHQDKNILSDSNRKSVSSNGNMVLRFMTSDDQASLDLNDVRASKVSPCTIEGSQPETKLDNSASKYSRADQQNQSCHPPQASTANACEQPHLVGDKEQLTPVDDTLSLGTINKESETSFVQSNGVHDVKGRSRLTNRGLNGNVTVGMKGLELECSGTHNSLDLDVNNDSEVYTNKRNVDSNGSATVHLGFQQKQDPEEGGTENEKDEIKACSSSHLVNDGYKSVYQNHSAKGSIIKGETAIQVKESHSSEVKCNYPIEGVEYNESRVDRKVDGVLGDHCNSQENLCTVRAHSLSSSCNDELRGTTKPLTDPSSASDFHLSPGNDLTFADKSQKESILEEARMIQAKHKRIAELSLHALPLENRRKSHWDFVIEEISWLANDFAQERIWKVTAAAQLCQQLAFTSQLRFEQQKKIWKLKEVAHTLAKAVMKFWYSAEELLGTDDSGSFPGNNEHDLVGTGKDDENEQSKNKIRDPIMESRKELEPQYSASFSLAVQKYAVRFLKYNCTITSSHAEGPKTPDRLLDPSILESSGVDQLKEILFYTIPLGAMDIYRKSIETHLMRLEKLSDSVQEEVDTSMYDDIAEFGYQDNSYFEDDGDTTMSMHYGVFEGGKPSKVLHKRRKNPMKSLTGRPYEISDFSYGYCTNGSQLLTLNGKRPASLNAGSIPTKRTRTASRQRILSPFNSSTAGIMHTQAKTDASSGDTSSFQDDHSTLHGPSQIQKSVEIESIGDFDKQIAYESVETSVKHKKKKKPKHLGSTYDHEWQLDSAAFGEQRDNSKRRLENHNFESNGMSGLYVQSNIKKPKMIKQSLDNTFASNPMAGSIPSPAASQMSNMSNTNRFIKLIGGRDRGRRAKTLKMSVGNSGAGTPWSLFEDQALVVLVHDMGPNWELVSDAINSTLQLKCIFRKPKECKERHKSLMDKSAGDGADSGEDSGTSQPYPSTLPGIPKGSARQLFQRLQEPMEEDTLKSHFEKIIKIGQKQYYRRSQNDNREAKQMAPVHNSHFIALSQVCPNNLNGVVLTPLDLCDASNPDAHSLGYQSSHASGISVSNQGAAATVLPSSGANSPLQGSSAIALGSNVSSFSGSVNTSIRDGRFGTQRMTSLPADDQQRIQQYNQMLSGRSFQQSNLSGAGNIPGSERSAKVPAGGNSPGLMGGMNRNMPVSRPGFQGMASSPMLNAASMVSSSVIGMPSPVNIHPSPTQGNPMLRPHDGLHMARPGHNSEHQRPMMIPELQIQATQGTSQGVQAFNGLSSTFANQTTPPSHTYSGHQQQLQMSPQSNHTTISSPNHSHLQVANHSAGSPQHAYPIRFPKERQLQQQRYLQQPPPQQQQQQLFTSASNSLMTQSQPPVSSSLQNSPQIQQQTLSHPTPVSSPATPMLSQQQQKHQLASPGLSRNPSIGSNNQLGKQRQRQSQQQHQFQQPNRHHPQQRPQTQSQHPAKLLKGVGRGNMMVHQSLALDPSNLNSLTMPSGNQASEKGEQMMQLVQGQSFFPGSGLNASQPSKPSVLHPSTHSQLHSKLAAGSAPPTSKQVQQMPSYSDNSSQTQVPQVSSVPTMAASHQARPSAVMISNHQQLQLQPQPSQKQLHQMQSSAQRMLQQNPQGISDQLTNCQTDQQPVNKTALPITIATIPHSCADSESTVPVVSNWKSSELTGNSTIPSSSQLCGSIGSPPLTNPAGSELQPFTQGSCLKQSLGGLTNQGLNVGSQFPQQTLLQTSPTQPQTSQKLEQVQEHQSPKHHLHLQQQSQQQSQHLQRGSRFMEMEKVRTDKRFVYIVWFLPALVLFYPLFLRLSAHAKAHIPF